MKKYNKQEAIKIITASAKKYDEELNRKTLMFLYKEKRGHISALEVHFYDYNFLHLTGVEFIDKERNSNIKSKGAKIFYRKCVDGNLSPNDFSFNKNGTSMLKLAVLPSIISKNLNAKMLGNYDNQKIMLYTEKVVGNNHACTGFRLDQHKEYVPNTLIQQSVKEITSPDCFQIIATFRKLRSAEKYDEVTYISKNIDWEQIELPLEYSYLKEILPNA